MRGQFADRNELDSAPEKKRAGRPLAWAGGRVGSLCFSTLVRNKARETYLTSFLMSEFVGAFTLS